MASFPKGSSMRFSISDSHAGVERFQEDTGRMRLWAISNLLIAGAVSLVCGYYSVMPAGYNARIVGFALMSAGGLLYVVERVWSLKNRRTRAPEPSPYADQPPGGRNGNWQNS